MKKKRGINDLHPYVLKLIRIMKLTVFLMLLSLMSVFASETYSQTTRITLNADRISLEDLLKEIEAQSEFRFFYTGKINVEQEISGEFIEQKIVEILDKIKEDAKFQYEVLGRQIILMPHDAENQIRSIQGEKTVSGTITDQSGEPLTGVTVVVKGTAQGTLSNLDGYYELSNVPSDAVLRFSFVGMVTKEIKFEGQAIINVIMEIDAVGLEEVVVIGYGTMKKSDLTGSVVRIDEEIISERPDISLLQSLRGSSSGLNIGQVNTAGGEPSFSIRGRTSISGEQAPLIVLDGVIFRGNITDINPNDIKSADILKDASSAAIYGSQASNGVIIITSKNGEIEDKPVINISSRYSFEEPAKKFIPESVEERYSRIEAGYFYNSRTESSGYLETDPSWDFTTVARTNLQLWAYENNIVTDWYDICTSKKMHSQSHNASLTKRTSNSGYFLSVGYTDQTGFMVNEDFSRWNARINVDNSITDWLEIGIQSFVTSSDYSGYNLSTDLIWENQYFAPAYDANGDLVESPKGVGEGSYNPIYLINSDDFDKNLSLFGNIYSNIKIPFIKGLSFKTNFNTNYYTNSKYYFRIFENSFLGVGSKFEGIRKEWTNDNILTYENTFNDEHKVIVTLVTGSETREFGSTLATATDFISKELGYNRLQAGNAALQTSSSDAWKETSLYSMARLFYSFQNKYLFTGTIRRDGFSGFSENNKFGLFPSMSVAWVASEERFLEDILRSFDQLKLRVSYGSNGNRTLNRYQTLATVNGGFNYIDGDNVPIYTHSITGLASPNLKWETTTGINLGIDFSFLKQKISGSIEYYSNDTKNLLYNVDIPGISRFETFPDNLGRLHNNGFELSVTSRNITKKDLSWTSQLVFSMNRNELKELLGFDNNGDGVEDDLVSEGLFIGESLSAIYTYKTNGDLWQLGEVIPNTADVGSYKIEDLDSDGVITPNDRTIIGLSDPFCQFSLDNRLNYKNWGLSIFINSILGNSKYYLGLDDITGFYESTQFDNRNFPKNLDFWKPENPDARYQRQHVQLSEGLQAFRYIPRSFIRFQDVNLSYTFDRELLNKLSIDNLRLYFNGKNLLTLTKWPGWDPETGQTIQINGRPVIRSYSFGIDVKF